jgi:hypothetical protein
MSSGTILGACGSEDGPVETGGTVIRSERRRRTLRSWLLPILIVGCGCSSFWSAGRSPATAANVVQNPDQHLLAFIVGVDSVLCTELTNDTIYLSNENVHILPDSVVQSLYSCLRESGRAVFAVPKGDLPNRCPQQKASVARFWITTNSIGTRTHDTILEIEVRPVCAMAGSKARVGYSLETVGGVRRIGARAYGLILY